MSLILDIGQGSGLAAANGVRPFLPAILAGALARGDYGVNFSGGDFAFLESIPFLLVVVALAVASYVFNHPPPALAAIAVGLGALLFAGSLTEGGREGWVGLAAGAACAALAWYASARFFARARARLEGSGESLLAAYGDLIALSIAIVAIVVPPLSFGALAAFLLLLVRGQKAEGRKYEGLRILR